MGLLDNFADVDIKEETARLKALVDLLNEDDEEEIENGKEEN